MYANECNFLIKQYCLPNHNKSNEKSFGPSAPLECDSALYSAKGSGLAILTSSSNTLGYSLF